MPRLVTVRDWGAIPAKRPLGIMFFARPFSEPTLLQIASAYEAAPPPDFGPVADRAGT
jgi:Asp-tRNA(Asn)/Glu-tRNA(Gln) amidotransferase A subunit family amidase